MFHILLLSAGSLLGQNVLDALAGRRDRVRITGLNTVADNPRLYRCNRAYRSPAAQSPEFAGFLHDVIEREQPDLILPGRDEDLDHLATLAHDNPSLAPRIPVGSPETARILNDKALSHRFALDHQLPFADTFVPSPDQPDEALTWAARIGYPVLAKPREGFGSIGIRIVCNEPQLLALLSRRPRHLVLQELLDFGDNRRQAVDRFLDDLETGVPLFFHLPDPHQFAGQALIRPDGSIGGLFVSRSLMVLGRCESATPVDDPELVETTRRYAAAFATAGWRGMFNLQCRQVPGGYRVHELNGRMSGSTSARRWLGFDEPRQLIRAFRNHDIGPDPRETPDVHGTVHRSLTDDFVPASAVAEFQSHGVWTAPRPVH